MPIFQMTVEADRYSPGALIEGIYGKVLPSGKCVRYVRDREGREVVVNDGDWIVRDPADYSLSVMCDDRFRRLFTEVESPILRD